MLTLVIPEQHLFNENTNEFIDIKETKIQLEHSLVSLRKWESKWKKPFYSSTEKTLEETLDYVRCMTITQNVNPLIYKHIPAHLLSEIRSYIEDPMTATWFSDDIQSRVKSKNGQAVTAELIYYWMITLGIPVEFEKWHLNQLTTLIRVINVENGGKKKMSKREAAKQRAALNAKRRAKYRTKG